MTMLASVLSLSLLAPVASDCEGDPGYSIVVPNLIETGTFFPITVNVPDDSLVLLFFSAGEGPTTTMFGDMCLDFPPLYTLVLPLRNRNSLTFPCTVPCDSTLLGFTGYLQFAALGIPGLTPDGISNQESVTVTDVGNCDCCPLGDPAILTMQYTGQGCGASANTQSGDECTGDAGFEPVVQIIASDKSNPNDKKAKIFFDDIVNLDDTYDIKASLAGEDKLKGNTYIFVYDMNGNLLETNKVHTSCSEPLNLGDKFGSHTIIDCLPDPGKGECEGQKAQKLTMLFDGSDCSATSHSQDPDKVFCADFGALPATVRILAVNEDEQVNPDKVWFDGIVNLNGSFEIDATMEGETKLDTETHVFIYDLSDNLLQQIEFHTSCSQALFIDDQFGSIILKEFLAE